MSWAVWLQVIGWLGSALLVFSVLQSKFLRFRILNGIASLVLMVYNLLLSSWPQVAMNAVLVVVDLYFLIVLLRQQRADKAFTSVAADDALRDWFLQANGRDLAGFHPRYEAERADCQTYLVFHQGKAIGLVAYQRHGTTAQLMADYVIPEYRDYAPGGYLYSAAGPLVASGLKVVAMAQPKPAVEKYLRGMGFMAHGDVYTKMLPASQ